MNHRPWYVKRITLSLLFALTLSTGGAQQLDAAPPTTIAAQAITAPAAFQTRTRPDSLLTAMQSDLAALKKENELYRTTLDVNSNLFGGISTYFAIVAILLSIIVLAIPLVNYFLVLKPNARLVAKVKQLESEVLTKIEANFERYFEDLRQQKNQQMLALLDDPLRISAVTNYFLLNDSGNLTPADIERILAFLREENGVEKSDLTVLNSLVIYSGFPAAEQHYKSIFERDDFRQYPYAIEYLVQNRFVEHLPYVEKIIAAAGTNSHQLLLNFFDYIRETFLGTGHTKKAPEKQERGIYFSKLLFDSDKIMQAIAGRPVPKHPVMGYKMNINVIIRHPFLRATKYYAVYLKEEDEKYGTR